MSAVLKAAVIYNSASLELYMGILSCELFRNQTKRRCEHGNRICIEVEHKATRMRIALFILGFPKWIHTCKVLPITTNAGLGGAYIFSNVL